MNYQNKAILLITLLSLAACGTTPEPVADAELGSGAEENRDALAGTGVQNRELGTAKPLSGAAAQDAAMRRQLTVYFDYDSSQIRGEFLPVLDAHARFLRDNPLSRIRLEGHSDERGTREYNIALGERRGEAVRRALLLRGATRSQLLVVSFGEEKPAVLGSGEAAWGKNRRVGMVYQ